MKQEDDWRVQREMISNKLWKDYRGVQKHTTDAPHWIECRDLSNGAFKQSRLSPEVFPPG